MIHAIRISTAATRARAVRQAQKRTRLDLALRDDPLMRLDQFKLLSGPAENDVTEKYVAA
jgi:hypothetical protein